MLSGSQHFSLIRSKAAECLRAKLFHRGTQVEIQGDGLTASRDQYELCFPHSQSGENCKEGINVAWEVMDRETGRLMSWGKWCYSVGEESSGTTCTPDLQFTGVLQYW